MRAHARAVATATSFSLLLVLGCAACTPQAQAGDPADEPEAVAETEADTGQPEEFVSTAMVVTLRDGSLLFVDQDTQTPYYPTLPEGSPELTAGNVVRVTGDGIMLESYPAQYPGIGSVEVIEEGAPADAEKYADLVAQLWSPKDPAEPPIASVEYENGLEAVSLMPITCGYTWSFEQDGEERTVSVDAPHPVQYSADELADARVDGATQATVSFDVPATYVDVTRYLESDVSAAAARAGAPRNVSASDVVGETLDAAVGEDGAVALKVEPGYRYALEVSFDAGIATYVFTVR